MEEAKNGQRGFHGSLKVVAGNKRLEPTRNQFGPGLDSKLVSRHRVTDQKMPRIRPSGYRGALRCRRRMASPWLYGYLERRMAKGNQAISRGDDLSYVSGPRLDLVGDYVTTWGFPRVQKRWQCRKLQELLEARDKLRPAIKPSRRVWQFSRQKNCYVLRSTWFNHSPREIFGRCNEVLPEKELLIMLPLDKWREKNECYNYILERYPEAHRLDNPLGRYMATLVGHMEEVPSAEARRSKIRLVYG